MRLTKLKPSKALNLAFRKVKPQREQIETFKLNLISLINQIDIKESEEFHKNIISKFLHDTYYNTRFYINTKHRNDLVIHNDKTAKSAVGVIIEAKSPINKSEMLRVDNINTKAFHELILYYLRERITHKNLEVKHLVVTNINEWFVFDANIFEKLFAQNKGLVKQFDDFESGRLAGKTTDFFYKEIADPFIGCISQEIEFTYFDIRDYEKPLRNADQKDDNKLISLFKLLSPEHLLKLPFTNDSNTLDKRFYSELLHIIGLSESKEGGKKIIGRNKEGQRNSGSLLEDAIIQLDSLDKISRLDRPSQYGSTHQERLFNVALELSITWINRVLFLKLLEAQLISYHKGDKSYSFLNQDRIKEYDDLNILFFQVLARRFEERNNDIKQLYEKVPYLNSSLFEPTEMEQVTLFISNLKDDKTIPIISTTVLKDKQGKKQTGSLSTLEYLFEFLNAYDFSSDGSEEIQEDNKTLVNASVLGLIFEKINGYKDGSFFTPGFVTMYMCRETIRKAIVQKFNETKNWNCVNFNELYNKIEDRNEANIIVNSIKICDPAVGSGHFLVSALNEMISVKNDLKILQDRSGKRLKEYQVTVVNDELIVTDEEGDLFEYNPTNKESQRIQETLFHEKQNIIENCLFGVDINQNSVKICRLRLWIELLKNAYYKNAAELETLPNIDINIKCGNSLVSRFALDSDLRQALKKSKWTIDSYRIAVDTYRNAKSKDQKKEMERLIADIKSDFRSEISLIDPKVKKLRKLSGELFQMTNQVQLFEKNKKEAAEWNKKVDLLTVDTKKLETEIEEIKTNKIFENAFEWRFEFPEVLNGEGEFVGFDVVIGNPPYGVNFNKENGMFFENEFDTFNLRGESYVLFVERAIKILNISGHFSFIIPDTMLNLGFTETIRKYVLKNTKICEVDLLPSYVFDDAAVDTILLFFQKNISNGDYNKQDVLVNIFHKKNKLQNLNNPIRSFEISSKIWYDTNSFNVQSNSNELKIISRIDKEFSHVESFTEMFSGIKAYEVGKGKPAQTAETRDTKPFTSKERKTPDWLPFFDGKDIGHYSLFWKNNNWIHYGAWLAAPRIPENFDGEKILIRKITGKTLIANYIPYTSYCNTLLFVLKLKPGSAKISYKALLGILNSKFIGWYFRKKFQIADSDTFPQIMIRDIQQFALPNVRNQITDEIENLVDSILAKKEETPKSDIIDLECQIDELVIRLYELTEDEVELIKGR
ncbi:N-6 DNA methylase [Arcticibacter pallidicorallinus]|uniref:site-specific DNA-methyltransferase (adenine-specific) n=1 Tax=Arcticibacter pallidicorallinus TaxID=1259464 RepID=A0A2T0U3Y8_9SPHI|nr:TaqI-like C-terminal specificity domain-containing protein [Arcticibacter pallidicorallinus]PRY52623.1 N-6 DNA methylase [Arcticibacter pallidicorallinus]